MNFVKKNVPVARGMQPTKWDKLLPEFVNPGDTLYFDPEEVKRPAVSQCAKRMMILDPTRRFHSGYDVLLKQTYVRVRPDGEIPDKEEEAEKASLADFEDEADEKSVELDKKYNTAFGVEELDQNLEPIDGRKDNQNFSVDFE